MADDTEELGALGTSSRGGRGMIDAMSGMSGVGTGIPPELMGALSSVMDPKRAQRNGDLAYLEGMLAPSATGGTSAYMSNAMASERKARENSDTLKAQYIPLIMQALNQQRQMQYQAAQFNAQRIKDVNPQIAANIAALTAREGATVADMHNAVDATLAQNGIPPQDGQAHHAYIDRLTMGPDGQHDPSKVPMALRQIAAQMPTDAAKNLMIAGQNPAQITTGLAGKDVRPEASIVMPDARGIPQTISTAPHPSKNQQYSQTAAGMVARPVPGAPGAAAGMAGAVGTAEANAKIIETKLPDGSVVPVRAGPAAAAGSAQAGLPGGGYASPPAMPQRQAAPAAATQPPMAPRPVTPQPLMPQQAMPRPMMPQQAAPQLGQSTAAAATSTASAKDMADTYDEMHKFATSSAPRNIGLLQSIYQLADKTLTGPGTNRIQFVNGVLNTMGITPTADSAQNYQIMEKNLGMLVGSQRMASRGGGSDALQTLLEASNPNAKSMNAPALKEAAAELIAYNRMMMDKDRLAPNPMQTSPSAYAQFETQFAPFSDPRIWQLHHAENDTERKRLLQLIPANSRASFLQRADAAIKSGFLQGGSL